MGTVLLGVFAGMGSEFVGIEKLGRLRSAWAKIALPTPAARSIRVSSREHGSPRFPLRVMSLAR
jgi:hypothetical protein